MFVKGEYFPLTEHITRIERYERNEKLAHGDHREVFLPNVDKNRQYISVNFPGLITRKSSDFLFGEEPIISSGKTENTKEQEALDRITQDNNMHRLNYQQSHKAAVTGDAFYKIRFGQLYGGAFPTEYDKPRVIIESVDPKKVYPQTSPFDKSKIVAYHIAEPIQVDPSDDKYELYVESHYSGQIVYRRFELTIFSTDRSGNVISFKIGNELPEGYEVEKTGVPVPLVIHIPNSNDGIDWQGHDDISEHISLFDELNNRITQLSMILNKHADPALAVPVGYLQDDGEGNVFFNVAANKVFEASKDDIMPQYIVNSSPLVQEAFKELEMIIEFLLSTSEIPAVAVGLKDSGTSGNSGLSIKWRMAGLLAKINRKRQFFEDGLKRVYMVAQMLEKYADPSLDSYEITVPVIKFRDGLPQDDTEIANRMSIRTNGSQTLSRKTALMVMDNLTEEQADAELGRIDEEKEASMVADPSIFNDSPSFKDKSDNRFDNVEDDKEEKKEEKKEDKE